MTFQNRAKAEGKEVYEVVTGWLEEFADSYEHPEEVLTWYYASADRLEGPTSMVLEDTVVEFVLSKAKVEVEELSFDALMGSNA